MDSKHQELELTYRQVSCQRSVSGANFASGGVLDYNFSIGGQTGFLPAKSYFRIGVTVSGPGGAAPLPGHQLALADGVCGNLFNNCFARMGGQDVSSVLNYSPQSQMVKTRLGKSQSWLESIGKEFGFDADFSSRSRKITKQTYDLSGTVALTAATGDMAGTGTAFLTEIQVGDTIRVGAVNYTVTRVIDDDNAVLAHVPANVAGPAVARRVVSQGFAEGRNTVYLMWQPPLGFFEHQGILGSGDYRISLNPSSSYKESAIESLVAKTAGTNYDFSVDSMELYIATVKAQIPVSGMEIIDLMECQVQSKPIVAGENNLDFTVPSSTKAITVFVQASNAGSDVRLPPSKFKSADDKDLEVKAIQLSYGNVSKPSTRWSSDYSGSRQQLSQRYIDSMLYSQGFWNPGGVEPLEDWMKRGALYHFDFSRDRDDRSTHLQLSLLMGDITGNNNVFVASHYSRRVSVKTEMGFVTDVQSASV